MTDNNTALKKAGLKVTLPRLKILEVLQEPDNHHVSAGRFIQTSDRYG